VSARINAITTLALFFVEDADQLQQLKGGGMDVGGQFGDFLTEAIEVLLVLQVGVLAGGRKAMGHWNLLV